MKIIKLFIGCIVFFSSCKSTDCGCPMANESSIPIQKKIVHSNDTMDYPLRNERIINESDCRE